MLGITPRIPISGVIGNSTEILGNLCAIPSDFNCFQLESWMDLFGEMMYWRMPHTAQMILPFKRGHQISRQYEKSGKWYSKIIIETLDSTTL